MVTKDSIIVTVSDSHHLGGTDYTHTSVYVLNTCMYVCISVCI